MVHGVHLIGRCLSGYKYFYVTPTFSRVGTSGGLYGYGYGVIGHSTTMSANPSDQISGYLISKGFIRVPEISDDIKGATVIVNYGEIGRRAYGLGSALEIVLQFIDAKSNEIVCTGTGEGFGETEADDIRMTITHCLDKIFEEMQVNLR